MQYALHCKLTRKNNKFLPKPFQIFLNVLRYPIIRNLRHPNQNLNQPSFLMTASTGKGATGISGVTLHFTFHLPVKSGLKFCDYKKPSDGTLHMLRNKYHYL